MVATRSRSATDDAPSFADLTDDTLVCVFQMLRPDDLGACLRTCKTWRRLICEGNMDERWWDIGALECGMSRDEKMKFPRSDGRRICDVVASPLFTARHGNAARTKIDSFASSQYLKGIQ